PRRPQRGRAEWDRPALGIDEDVRPPGLLELRQPRRMIARDRVDRAGRRTGPHRLAIAAVRRPQRRADLRERSELGHLLVAEQQILRTRFGPHALALPLSPLDPLDPQPRAEIAHVPGTGP